MDNNINGIPLVWDTQGDSALFGGLLPQDLQIKNFEGLPRSSGTYESPFGKDSVFYTPNCTDFDDDFYDGGINYELLAKDLYEKTGSEYGLFFDYEKYKVADKEVPSSNSVPFVGVVFEKVKDPKPFTYKTVKNEFASSFFEEGKLNRMKCYIKKHTFGIYYNDYKVTYALNFIYYGTENEMKPLLSTSNPYDIKLEDKYNGIMLYTVNVNTFLAFLGKTKGGAEMVRVKNRVIAYFNDFFATAGDDADKIDGLYQCIPDFVLDQIPDGKLWKDLKILSEASINTSGTNENVAIINLLKGVKNKNWWYDQINLDPEPIRKMLENFHEDYLYELIALFSSIGYGVWTNDQVNDAWPYFAIPKIINSEYTDPLSSGGFTRAVSFSYFIENEKKYKIGTALFWHSQQSFTGSGDPEGEQGPNMLQLPFAPMLLKIDNSESFHIPAFVAEYFTKQGIEEADHTLLSNIVTYLMPEINVARTKVFFTKGKSVANIDELGLSWMASRKIGNLGGNILKATQIRKLRGILKVKGIHLIVEGDVKSIIKLFKPAGGFKTIDELFYAMRKKGFVGGFNAETKQLFLSKNATEIVVFHEMAHLTHFEGLGNVYLSLNKLEKETYVWEQILANRTKWTKTELDDALNYINGIRVEEYGFEPLKIKQ